MRRGRGGGEEKEDKKVVSETEEKIQPLLVYFPLWLVIVCLFVCCVCAGGCGVAPWRRDSNKDSTGRGRASE